VALRQQAGAAVTILEPNADSANGAAPQRHEFLSDLVTLSDSRLAEAEAIRTVRTHIIARHLEDGRRGVAVCAPTAGAGCSFTAANLAVALSQVGVSTLLIDADMRKPGLEALIRPMTPAIGLKQYLTTPDRPRSDFIHSEVLPNLSLLYSGGASDSAQELLGGEVFRDLIDRCLRDFEFTIVDTPPTNDSADALRTVSVVGYALVVARTNVTRLRDLTVLSQQLQEDGGRIIGAVLNEA
jgi:protein-tyrosine kinase